MKNVFIQNDVQSFIDRIEKLNPKSKPIWGKMDVAQMLAHCNVTYEMIFENKHPKPSGFKKLILNLFVKKLVVNEKPYKKNSPTAPQFIIKSEKDFEYEKARLISFIKKVQELGENYFEGKESHSFGKLNKTEWNNMMVKHLEHHLEQFNV